MFKQTMLLQNQTGKGLKTCTLASDDIKNHGLWIGDRRISSVCIHVKWRKAL